MIQPAAAGSMVRIMAEGLDWSGGEGASPSAPKNDAGAAAADDAEAKAQKALQDALKGIPKL